MANTKSKNAATGTAHYAGMAAALALLVGAVLLLSNPLRLGWIADLLSVPVTTGFLAGISVHIIVGQLPAILGIDAPSGPLIGRLAEIMPRLCGSCRTPVPVRL